MLWRTLPVLALATALTGCGLDNFKVTVEDDATIPGNPIGAVLDFGAFGGAFGNIDVLTDQQLRNEGVDAKDIDSARVEVLELTIPDGQGAGFETWLDAVAFYVEAEGLERKLVAQKTGIHAMPAGTRKLDLDVTRAELKPYVAKTMTIVTEATGRPPVKDTPVHARAVIGVDASVSHFLGL